ncbi:PspC domain-containing protein [Mariniflexile ostreae]|uniref:PspC domain-containing protein n=1 Tax=Mariniflexile ostreae TaxID=1520892 RepID=A0ABV5FA81_9FLAO
MNKTVNINLAGIFFHIDEDAYLKLQRYLDAIKRSFTDSNGRSEILADIEARIAELFMERVKHDKQVIGINEVEAIIAIMGQPEDYLVDDEIFDDESKTHLKTKTPKKLFRDTDNSYIGGVASGLGHYLGINAVWMRLIWLLLVFGSGGTFILIYILFWILVPEAKTTAEKIMMHGEPVNITNIEKKIKDGFDTVSKTVSETVKNVDLPKQGQRIKSTSKSFFDGLSEAVMFTLQIFAKIFGVFLIAFAASVLIALIVALFSLSVIDIVQIRGLGVMALLNATNVPLWLIYIFSFFAIGIPFFFIFYLGLKILVNNLKSIGSIAKFTWLGLWLISIIGLIVIGIRQASEHAFEERYMERYELPITAQDTVKISMSEHELFNGNFKRRENTFKMIRDANQRPLIYASDIRIAVKPTRDSLATMVIAKSADGSHYDKAINRAKNIQYKYQFKNNELLLDAYWTTDPKHRYNDQEVKITLYLPEGSVIYSNKSTESFYYSGSNNHSVITQEHVNHFVQVFEPHVQCLDCSTNKNDNDFSIEMDMPKVKIDKNGIELKSNTSHIKINQEGLDAKSDDVNINISKKGIKVKS